MLFRSSRAGGSSSAARLHTPRSSPSPGPSKKRARAVTGEDNEEEGTDRKGKRRKYSDTDIIDLTVTEDFDDVFVDPMDIPVSKGWVSEGDVIDLTEDEDYWM